MNFGQTLYIDQGGQKSRPPVFVFVPVVSGDEVVELPGVPKLRELHNACLQGDAGIEEWRGPPLAGWLGWRERKHQAVRLYKTGGLIQIRFTVRLSDGECSWEEWASLTIVVWLCGFQFLLGYIKAR